MDGALETPDCKNDAAAPFHAASCSALALDVCCGPRGMWFNKKDPRAVFMDRREGEWEKATDNYPGRSPIVVAPDVLGDFTDLPFPDESFWHVVMDPPHHTSTHFGGASSIMQNTYGVLLPGWREMLERGFAECFRVLKPCGTFIFKWCSREIPLAEVLALTPEQPLYGHKSGKKQHTHWVAFMKQNASVEAAKD